MANLTATAAAPPRPLLRAALLIAGFFAIDKAAALLRTVIIARVFGVSPLLDAFNAANNVPDLLFTLISGGALSIALIPVLSEYFDQHGRAAGWEVFSMVANLAFVATAVLALLVAVFALPLVQSELGIAPGFDASQQVLVAQLMRLNLVATLIFSVSGLVIGGLQANQHFLLPALAPTLYNCGQIFGAVVLAPQKPLLAGLPLPALGLGVHGLVYGVIIGALLHLAVQLPGLWRYGFRWRFGIALHHPGVLRILMLLGPRLAGLGAFQLTELMRDNLASRMAPGSVTALTYGWFLMQVPETIIGTAVGTALLPTLATLMARHSPTETERSAQILSTALRVVIALTMPIAVAAWFYLPPLVQLVFEGRAFTPEASKLVVFAARLYFAGLLGHAALELGARAFYARKDALTPTLVALVCMLLQVTLALALTQVRVLGYGGLALANSIAFSVQAFALLVLLRTRHRAIDQRQVLRGLAQAGLATAAMGGVLWVGTRGANSLWQLAGIAVLAAALYVGMLLAAGFTELRELGRNMFAGGG